MNAKFVHSYAIQGADTASGDAHRPSSDTAVLEPMTGSALLRAVLADRATRRISGRFTGSPDRARCPKADPQFALDPISAAADLLADARPDGDRLETVTRRRAGGASEGQRMRGSCAAITARTCIPARQHHRRASTGSSRVLAVVPAGSACVHALHGGRAGAHRGETTRRAGVDVPFWPRRIARSRENFALRPGPDRRTSSRRMVPKRSPARPDADSRSSARNNCAGPDRGAARTRARRTGARFHRRHAVGCMVANGCPSPARDARQLFASGGRPCVGRRTDVPEAPRRDRCTRQLIAGHSRTHRVVRVARGAQGARGGALRGLGVSRTPCARR